MFAVGRDMLHVKLHQIVGDSLCGRVLAKQTGAAEFPVFSM